MSDSDFENGLLSFSNPNYQLEPADVNSNLNAFDDYEDLYEEFDSVCSAQRHKSSIKSRRKYAQLDSASMGIAVDHETSPMLSADYDNNLKGNLQSTTLLGKAYHKIDNENPDDVDSNDNKDLGRPMGFLDYYINLETALRQAKDASAFQSIHSSNNIPQCHSSSSVSREKKMTVESENVSAVQNSAIGAQTYVGTGSHDSVERKSHVHHKDQQMPSMCNIPKKHSSNHNVKNVSIKETDILPSGWEKHEDESGPYYWHINSGTIQREPPCSSNCKIPAQISKGIEMISSVSDFSLNSQNICSSIQSVTSEPVCNKSACADAKNDYKRRSYPERSCSITADKRPVRFAVRSLGWVEIAEDDLTPEKSSKAVNKCIVDLSMGRNDILDVVGRWGDGKDLYMDLDDYSLRLMDTQDLTVLNTQPIHTIRVWGVGRDNGRERDFAYVARDRMTRKYMCHVFRCDIPARIIANTLRDICKKIMIERSLQQNLGKRVVPDQNTNGEGPCITLGTPTRPTNFPIEQQRFLKRDSSSSYAAQSFPTPMEEPKKVLKVHYLGTINVGKATGVDVLNDAIEQLSTTIPPSEYKFVNVAVAPSTITISEHGENGKMMEECRVRFLSFLGIGKNVKHCGFIVHTAQDQFVAHVFYCEPSSGALCKTIEAACKLRYQKCLDAHRKINEKQYSAGNKGLGTTLRSFLGSISRLAKNVET